MLLDFFSRERLKLRLISDSNPYATYVEFNSVDSLLAFTFIWLFYHLLATQ